MNQYPLWKYLLVLVVITIGIIYALPNLYGEDPAIQISSARAAGVEQSVETRVRNLLDREAISYRAIEHGETGLTVRLHDAEAQLKAKEFVSKELGQDFVVALNLAPATPDWLSAINAAPMYLGLDLRGGVHFLLDVDMQAAIEQAEERYVSDIRTLLRSERIRYVDISTSREQAVRIKLRDQQDLEQSRQLITGEYPDLVLDEGQQGGDEGGYVLTVSLSEQERKEIRQFALEQNVTTLRNRVNELGVAEPVIQRQGSQRHQ